MVGAVWDKSVCGAIGEEVDGRCSRYVSIKVKV